MAVKAIYACTGMVSEILYQNENLYINILCKAQQAKLD
jgi:hypothetical protein